ncbi:pilus assembly protein [Boseongicola sp. H5]|uniref:pilus assembly protein n=1 Tax=Boseongicola sp. H5 TaxID=2763261 RepID=UPI001D0AF100|nr:pilus assembly protein [Boseongicola sp. H5]
MTKLMKTFIASESGAVTVDWVVLTAAIVGLGLAVMAVVSGGVGEVANSIDTALGEAGATEWDFTLPPPDEPDED